MCKYNYIICKFNYNDASASIIVVYIKDTGLRTLWSQLISGVWIIEIIWLLKQETLLYTKKQQVAAG